MKFVATLLATSAAALSSSSKYMQYILEHSKSYITLEEFTARKALFDVADELVESHNQTNASFRLAHNKFSDMTEDEKANTRGLAPKNQMERFAQPVVLDESSTPSSVDWRGTAVNPIRDQGQCGSCWAFSSVCALEGAHYMATGTLAQFSEQQLVDCAGVRYGNFGCNGGLQERAFSYYETHSAISRDAYPYTAQDGSCQYDSLSHAGVEVSTYVNSTPESSSQTKASLAQQPLSVSIEADKLVFQLYSTGVFDSTSCGTQLDHAVALVGYGTESGQDYFILRNSWGSTWGESGYMKIADTGNGVGICGVLSDPLYPNSN
jgi:C1A family cysteine protease